MKVNSGGIDRALRVILGATLVGMAFTGNVGAWGWIGVVPLVTGIVGLCPLYSLLGLNTCPVKKA